MIWLLCFILSVVGCFSISLSMWDRYQVNPTVISVERDYQTWNTSFPAVTVCSEMKYNATKVKELTMMNNTNKKGEEMYLFLKELSSFTYENSNMSNFEDLIFDPKDYLSLVYQVKFDMSYEVSSSANLPVFPMEETVLESGNCYTFHSAAAKYNSYLYWKSGNLLTVDDSPEITGNPQDGELYYHIKSMPAGGVAYVHARTELPDTAVRSYTFNYMELTTVKLMGISIYSTDSVRNLNVKQRKCRYFEESELIISPVYTYNLCRAQCRMQLALKLCKCIPYFYRNSGVFQICDLVGMECLNKNQEMLVKLLFKRENGIEERVPCDCYPPCEEVNFIMTDFNHMGWLRGTEFKWGIEKYPRIKLKRDILFGMTDLLVSIGGTAGLFLGCSVLSFMEALYFFTFKLPVYIFIQYHDRK